MAQHGPHLPRALTTSSKQLRVVVHSGHRLARRHPLVAKMGPTAFGFAFGDFLTQYMNRGQQQQQQRFNYEWQRGAKMAAVGALVAAPVGLGIFKLMDLVLASPQTLGANALKFTVDQVIGCALWQAAYCIIHPPYRQALEQVLASAAAGVEQQSAEVRRRLQLQPLALA